MKRSPPGSSRRHSRNAWLDQDRQDQRKVVVTAVLFGVAVLGGVGLLVYALIQH